MYQLQDHTPFKAAMHVLPNPDGIDSLYITQKATFTFSPRLEVAAQQRPLRTADVYHVAVSPALANQGAAPVPSLLYPCDIGLCRPATDLVVLGSAYAPAGRPVATLDVALAVADKTWTIRVFGDRRFTGNATAPLLSAPLPFSSMPLSWDRAFGGTHARGGEERNPAGLGHWGKRSRDEIRDLPGPNLEDPRALLRALGDQPPPASWGAVAPSWLPRRSYAGTYDEHWRRRRAPFLPRDFDSRFLQVAVPSLVQQGYLQGGERVALTHLSPAGSLSFRLPRLTLAARVNIAGQIVRPPLHLEMVLIEPDKGEMELLFRGMVTCGKQVMRIRQIDLQVQALDL